MTVLKAVLFSSLVAGAALSVTARAQGDAGGCTHDRGVYTCDWQVFRARFDVARTVSLEAQPMDRSTESQLRQLVVDLGKSVAGPDRPGDLVFRVAPVDPTGIAIGPADQPLGSLQVYAAGSPGSRGTLLWVETFTGQADRPWPTMVNALINQFRERFRKRGR